MRTILSPGHPGEGRPVYEAGHSGTLPFAQHQLHRRGAAEISVIRRTETGGCWKEHLLLQIKMIPFIIGSLAKTALQKHTGRVKRRTGSSQPEERIFHRLSSSVLKLA